MLMEIRQPLSTAPTTADSLSFQGVRNVLIGIRTDRQRGFDIWKKIRHPMMHPPVGCQKPNAPLSPLKLNR
jgi:hypothetical protein